MALHTVSQHTWLWHIHISSEPWSWLSDDVTIWLFNIAMENGPFIDDFPIKTSIYKGFSMAMLNNQRVCVYIYIHTHIHTYITINPDSTYCQREQATKDFAPDLVNHDEARGFPVLQKPAAAMALPGWNRDKPTGTRNLGDTMLPSWIPFAENPPLSCLSPK